MTDDDKYPPGRGHAWRGDWKARLADLVRARGFSSVTEFAALTPTHTLPDLSNDLGGGNVAPIQLQWSLVEEARRLGTLRHCARDLLVRVLREVTQGWPAERGFEAQEAVRHRLIAWSGSLQDPRFDPLLDRIAESMLDADDMPSGWMPIGVDDPIILRWFDRHWPLEPGTSSPGATP